MPSNADVAIPRNWIRHRLVPLLAAHLNADIVEVLARESAVLRDETALLERLANEAAARVETALDDGRIALEAAALAELNPALARRVVRQALGADRARAFPRVRPRRAGARAGDAGRRPHGGGPAGRPRGTKCRERCLI